MSSERPGLERSRQPGESNAPLLRLAVAWAFVGIPLAWGVWQVFQKSLALFR